MARFRSSAARVRAELFARVLMTGEAGWGKTAFAAHLFNTDPTGRLLAAHFCRNERPDTVDPHRFVENIAALTALRVEPYNERLRTLIGAHPELLAIPSAAEKFERLFLEPLDAASKAAPLDPLPRYFLVDGLDETLSKEKETIHGLLVQSERLFPSWLKLIATTRETSIVTGAFSDPVIAKFERHDQRNLSDITQIVKNVIEGRAPGRTVVPLPHVLEELVRVVTAKADGIAYYATQLAREVRGSGLDLHAITALPRETVAFNLAMFRRRFDPEGPEWAAAREVLEMVLATPDIVPIQLVVSVRGDESEIRNHGPPSIVYRIGLKLIRMRSAYATPWPPNFCFLKQHRSSSMRQSVQPDSPSFRPLGRFPARR